MCCANRRKAGMKKWANTRTRMERRALGIDIGGTKIAAGIVSESGRVISATRVATRVAEGREAVLGQIRRLVEQFASRGSLAGIGIGTGGSVDAVSGEVVSATPLLPSWKGVNLKRILERETALAVLVDNDVNAAALAERHFGWGRERRNFVLLSIGTGLGGGIVINGKLVRGTYGYAGEIGHLIIVAEGRHCNCGKKGCLEAYVSGQALVHQARRHRSRYPRSAIFRSGRKKITTTETVSANHILRCARDGDRLAWRLLVDMARSLAIGIDGIFAMLDPDCVVLTGGIVEGGPQLLLRLVRERLRETSEYGAQRAGDVVLSRLRRYAGIQGAACLALASISPR